MDKGVVSDGTVATEPSKVGMFNLFNPFHGSAVFLYFLKTSEDQRFSYVFRGCKKRPVV